MPKCQIVVIFQMLPKLDLKLKVGKSRRGKVGKNIEEKKVEKVNKFFLKKLEN